MPLKRGRVGGIQGAGGVSDDELPALIEFQWAIHATFPLNAYLSQVR
ncbi:MAG: hypothetical protein ACLPWF_11160 [Bryobacteraceae bacterium]